MKTAKKLIILIAVLFLVVYMAAAARESISIEEVTLNGEDFVDAAAGENITASVSVQIHSESEEWKSTKYRIGDDEYVCLDTQDYDEPGNYTETFTITAPLSIGEYNFKVKVYSRDGCRGDTVSATLADAINVISVCGDGIVEEAEQCDDSNAVSEDGCSSACLLESTYYYDSDNDGYGSSLDFIMAVSMPEGYVEDDADCNDNDETINPDAEESCNGVDDNCDSEPDEGEVCPLVPYYCDDDGDGYAGTEPAGECSSYNCMPEECPAEAGGDCNDDDESINSDAEESCNAIDDNCDGEIDEELLRPDDNLVGLCSANTELCNAGGWTDSATNYVPAEEICDGLDNNCNSIIDEGNFSDADADGVKDCVDTDRDNDDVDDGDDMIDGAGSDINTNLPGGIVFSVNDTQDAASYAGVGTVRLANSTGRAIVEFDYDFANNTLDLRDINITANSIDGFGSMIIKGINLSRQNATKTAYIDRKAGTNTLCIIDDEVDAIVVEGDCSNGIKLQCEAPNGQYTCSMAENSTMYKVTGLMHSAVSEYSYSVPPAVEPAQRTNGGTSGNLIVVSNAPSGEAPAENPAEEEQVAQKAAEAAAQSEKQEGQAKPLVKEPEQPGSRMANARARFGQITGRMVASVRNSPGLWGGGMGMAVAVSLITAIYISTRKVTKRFYKN